MFERGGRLDARRAVVFARARLRQGIRRVRTALEPVLIAAVGAALAWAIAHDALHQPAPLFAPMAAWICLGFTKNRSPRIVAELALGATVGVGLGELFVSTFGAGAWQIGVVLVAAALAGRLLDRGDVVTFQTVGNGLVIVGLSAIPGMELHAGGRWMDALVGGAVAFVLTVALPRSVVERPRRYARSAFAEMAQAIEMLADGLRRGDVEAMMDVEGQVRATTESIDDFDKALKAAADVAALNPTLRAEVPQLDELKRILALARRAETGLAMMVRQAVGFYEQAGRLPDVGDRLAEVGPAVRALSTSIGGWHRPQHARDVLSDVAAKTAPHEIESQDWRPAALMSLVRALVSDLLQVTGLSRSDAAARLAATHGAPFAAEREASPEDEASALWGD